MIRAGAMPSPVAESGPERRRRRNEARIRAALSRLLAGPPGAGLTVAMLAREERARVRADKALTDELLIFLDGGLAGARILRDSQPLRTARSLAESKLGAPPPDYSI